MDEPDQRLLAHIKLCHRMLAQLVSIVEMLWENVQLDHPEMADSLDGERLQRLIDTIRHATEGQDEQQYRGSDA
jgi:hypothetical protein